MKNKNVIDKNVNVIFLVIFVSISRWILEQLCEKYGYPVREAAIFFSGPSKNVATKLEGRGGVRP